MRIPVPHQVAYLEKSCQWSSRISWAAGSKRSRGGLFSIPRRRQKITEKLVYNEDHSRADNSWSQYNPCWAAPVWYSRNRQALGYHKLSSSFYKTIQRVEIWCSSELRCSNLWSTASFEPGTQESQPFTISLDIFFWAWRAAEFYQSRIFLYWLKLFTVGELANLGLPQPQKHRTNDTYVHIVRTPDRFILSAIQGK